ncbi:MAG: UMP kinase, partial [Candidatus Omnitrophica bacterium]|nr:UMP kinase [Candidatus Omnitrophota bacterium]
MKEPVYKRILLKLSGEALQGRHSHGIDQTVLNSLAKQIKEVKELGVEIAIVLGGGNIFRGLENTQGKGLEMERSVADYMGMLA